MLVLTGNYNARLTMFGTWYKLSVGGGLTKKYVNISPHCIRHAVCMRNYCARSVKINI